MTTQSRRNRDDLGTIQTISDELWEVIAKHITMHSVSRLEESLEIS